MEQLKRTETPILVFSIINNYLMHQQNYLQNRLHWSILLMAAEMVPFYYEPIAGRALMLCNFVLMLFLIAAYNNLIRLNYLQIGLKIVYWYHFAVCAFYVGLFAKVQAKRSKSNIPIIDGISFNTFINREYKTKHNKPKPVLPTPSRNYNYDYNDIPEFDSKNRGIIDYEDEFYMDKELQKKYKRNTRTPNNDYADFDINTEDENEDSEAGFNMNMNEINYMEEMHEMREINTPPYMSTSPKPPEPYEIFAISTTKLDELRDALKRKLMHNTESEILAFLRKKFNTLDYSLILGDIESKMPRGKMVNHLVFWNEQLSLLYTTMIRSKVKNAKLLLRINDFYLFSKSQIQTIIDQIKNGGFPNFDKLWTDIPSSMDKNDLTAMLDEKLVEYIVNKELLDIQSITDIKSQ